MLKVGIRETRPGGRVWSLADFLAEGLATADPYWVSADMLDVVDAAAPSMPGEVLHVEDLPSPAGFAVLERSVIRRDVRGRRISFRAVSWWAVASDGYGSGVLYALWTDAEEPEDDINADLGTSRRALGRFQLMHAGVMPFDTDPATIPLQEREQGEGPPLLPPEQVEAQAVESWRWHLTFWRMMGQRIAHTTEARPDRATARRLARTTLAAPEFVQVVTLRQYRDKQPPVDGEGEGVRWSRRWIVGGHWRNQWYASLGRHRAIWIAPFVKGPADKDLVVAPRVYRWTR